MKRFLVLFTVLCTLLCAGVIAAEGAQETAWYEESVQNVISTGILASGSDLFLPEANVTAKDLTAAAARLNNLYKGGSTQLPADYDFATYYTNYISANGLNSGVTVAGEDQEMTRADVVTILYNAIKDYADLTAINNCLDIADSNTAASYYAAALNFTNAGIVAGYDEYGSFMPSNLVKRYELCVMLDRILNVNERVEAEYIVYASDEPFYLIDDNGYHAAASLFENSGWRMDYTGSEEIGSPDAYNVKLNDFSTTDNMKLSRKVHVQEKGELTFEAMYKITHGNELYFDFLDSDGELLFRAGWDNGVAFLEGQGSPIVNGVELNSVKETSSTVSQLNNRVSTKIILNLDEKTAEMWMGTTYCGKVNLKDGFANFAEVEILTGVEEIVLAEIKNVHLYKNYLVNDMFIVEQQGKAPIGYTTSGDVTVAKIDSASVGQGDYNSAKITATAGKKSYAKKTFKKTGGKVIIESYILLYDTASASPDGEVYFTAYSAGVPVIKVKTTGDAWYAENEQGQTKLRDIASNIWQRIRIEADTAKQTALIRINGKTVMNSAGTAPADIKFLVKADGFDAVEVGIDATSNGVIWFDDVEVYETFDYDDYCPEPTPLDTGDYVLNMSVCSLWRNGSHNGWDWISSYPELVPALGFYDEGNPEVADWEIKYLTEHGIKNQMLCWYPLGSNAPIKKPTYVYDALHEGFFNAKYSDLMTFSLMFENASYSSSSKLEDFKNYVFPYWMDMYFKDPRYCKIDKDGGKYLFLNIFSWSNWKSLSGGTEASGKALIDWMKNEVVTAGIADGMIVCFGGTITLTPSHYTAMNNMGADGIIFYAWTTPSENLELQSDYYATKAYEMGKGQGIDVLALPSVGFSGIGWAKTRTGLMSTEDFEDLLVWYKDTYLGEDKGMLGADADVEDWKKKFVTFDTWNEYGEGHYMMPTATVGNYNGEVYGGFGYLDAISKVFGNEADPTGNNHVPEGEAKLRIGRLYPSYDQYVRREQLTPTSLPDSLKYYKGYSSFTSTSVASGFQNSQCQNTSSHTHSTSFWSSCTYVSHDSSSNSLKLISSASAPARVCFEASSFTSFACANANYLHLKLKVQDGGDLGKVYFKTSNENSYEETKTYRFYTYEDVHDYYIKLDSNAKWNGNFKGIMLEYSNKANKTAYIYALEFLQIDESKQKTQIVVDGVVYEPRDYAEIEPFANTTNGYTPSRKELYIAPSDEQGLLRMLHITREWKRDEGKLLLETPDGTTFEFEVGSNQVIVNGNKSKPVTLSEKISLYDGVPVLPLIYILKTAGYDYAYDYTNKKIDIVVAQSYRMVEDITNGDAEGTDTTEFNLSGASNISITTDPEDSSNKVWKIVGKDSQSWSYLSTDVDFVAGKTYTVDFDIYFDSLGSNNTQASGGVLAVNFIYPDTNQQGTDHSKNLTEKLTPKTWTHFTYTYTVADTHNETGSGEKLGFFINPQNNLGATYYMDNIVIRTYADANIIKNGNAEGVEDPSNPSFRPNSSSESVTIETDSDGNKYWQVNSSVANRFTYLIQDTKFERGVTYYYKFRIKLGQTASGEDVTKAIVTLNVRYYDVVNLHNKPFDSEWYKHQYSLRDKNGNDVYLSSGGDWVDCYGSFTVSLGFDPDNTSVKQQITLYCNPLKASGTDFMIDDFQISTEGPID